MRPAAPVAGGILAALLTLGLIAVPAQAENPEPDQLAVVVVGDGETYENVAGPATIQMIDSTGGYGDAVRISTEGADGQHPFTIGVDRDQAGALQQSADRSVVTLGGYDAQIGEATNGSLAPDTLRIIASVDAAGNVDTSTSLAGAYNERHIRGVASVDGTRYWTGGHGNDSEEALQAGVLSIERGGETPTAVTTGGSTVNNTRVPLIHDGQLYVSSDRSGYHGVNAVGEGLPTAESDMELVAAAPAGSEVPHDFVFIGEHLYVAYTEGAATLARYTQVDGGWEIDGTFSGQFWGLTGREAGDEHVLYGTRGSDAQNELVAVVTDPAADFGEAQDTVLATADPNTAFRGVSFAPGFTPEDGPVAVEHLPTTNWDTRVAGGAGNALSAVIGASSNPQATGTIADPDGERFTVAVASADESIVATDDIALDLADDGSFTLAAEPSGVGITSITLTITTDDGRVGTSRLSYAASAALPANHAIAHVGMADASAAYDVGDGHFVVADDDSNQLRLYGPTFGEPVKEFDFTSEMDHPTDRTFDLEGAARIDDTIYWVGSLGNSRSGNYWPHRDIVFATQVSGAGSNTELEFVGEATGFRDALTAWDNNNAHGEGAGAFQFERATTPGVSAEGPNSLNLEGATVAPDGSTLWLGFRSPLVPVAADLDNDAAGNLALVVGIENIAESVSGDAAITVAEHFTLDLDGRAIRDLAETDDGHYLIAAGSADDAGNFAMFGWDGDPGADPVISSTPLGLEGWAGSYEAIPGAASLTDGSVIRVLQDAGTVDIYGTGAEAQDLTREHMKFPTHDYTLDFDGAFGDAVTQTLELNRSEAHPGDTITATARGFASGEEVTFTLHSAPAELGSATANTDGVAIAELTVPRDAEAGAHTLVAAAPSGAAEVGLTVLELNGASNNSAETLATTGHGLAPYAIGALLLLALGGGAILLSRRTRGALIE